MNQLTHEFPIFLVASFGLEHLTDYRLHSGRVTEGQDHGIPHLTVGHSRHLKGIIWDVMET